MTEQKWKELGMLQPLGEDMSSEGAEIVEVGDVEGAEVTEIGRVAQRRARPQPQEGWVTYAVTAGQGSSIALTPNAVGVESVVLDYVLPTGMVYNIRTRDDQQEILFLPYSSADQSDASFILGTVKVFLIDPTGGTSTKIYESNTVYHRPTSNQSTVGHMRHPQVSAMVKGGWRIQVRFMAGAALVPTASLFIMRMIARPA